MSKAIHNTRGVVVTSMTEGDRDTWSRQLEIVRVMRYFLLYKRRGNWCVWMCYLSHTSKRLVTFTFTTN